MCRFGSCLTIIGIAVSSCFAQWQQTLESRFDIAETFDELQDWQGAMRGDNCSGDSYPDDFPKKKDGSKSIWNYYSFWKSSASSRNWIDFHGEENVWTGDGKSLCLDYATNDGPERFGTYIGDGDPSKGYSDVHIFYFTKYTEDFFPHDNSGFDYYAYLKTLEACTGFRAVMEWGTPEEQAVLGNSNARKHNYGLNYVILNIREYYGGLTPLFSKRISSSTGTTVEMEDTYPRADYFGDLVRRGEWFAIEYRLKLSEPAGADNGVLEVWAYDMYGNTINHHRYTQVTFAKPDDPSRPFNHRYNKFFWGGNRSYDTNEGHVYIDDIVIDDQRIGPTYFEMLGERFPGDPTTIRVVPRQNNEHARIADSKLFTPMGRLVNFSPKSLHDKHTKAPTPLIVVHPDGATREVK